MPKTSRRRVRSRRQLCGRLARARYSAALIGVNQLGYARVLYVPVVVSAGQVQTAFRRAAQQRLYPLTLTATCPYNNITWTDLTAIATS